MSEARISELLDFLSQLKQQNIHYVLSDWTAGAIMVEVAVPGERWEIEFHSDGEIGVELFKSDGVIRGPDALPRLLRQFGDMG